VTRVLVSRLPDYLDTFNTDSKTPNVGDQAVDNQYIMFHVEFLDQSELPGFSTFSIIRYYKKLENTVFRDLDLFPSLGEGGDICCVGSLR
jgi:hypothetical protein